MSGSAGAIPDTARPGQPWLMLLDTFGDPAMKAVFSEEATVRAWLEVERALAVTQGRSGVIPVDAAAAVVARIDAMRVAPGSLTEGFRHVGYPIVTLLAEVGRGATDDVGAYLHWGATTQDIMDTGVVLQLRAALDRIHALTDALGTACLAHAVTHRETLMAARTHGQQAVPTTFGAKVAVWLAELTRHMDRLRQARPRVLVVQLFGAGGTGAAMGTHSRAVRHALARELGLEPVDVPWHAARDGIAEAAALAASLASTCVRIAREVADLARTEIAEVHETFSHGRGASSTMPQKHNPILSEAVIGMGSIAASQLPAMQAAMQVRHERATGEWQIEWDVVPSLFALTAGCLATTTELVAGLSVDATRMRANLDLDGGLIMAEALMMALAPMVGRASSHELVYELCARARAEGRALRDVVRDDLPPDLAAQLPGAEVLLDPGRYVGEVADIVDTAVAGWERRGGGS